MRQIDKRYGWRKGVALVAAVPMLVGLLQTGTAVAAQTQSDIHETTTDASKVLDLGFDNTLADASTTNNPTKLHKGESAYIDGVDGKALQLTDGSLNLGTSQKLQPSDLTLSFWWKPTGTMSGEQILMWAKGNYNGNGWYLSSASSSKPLVLSVGVGNAQPLEFNLTGTRDSVFPADTWTHVMVSFDGATKTARFFINGEGKASTAGNTGSPGTIVADNTTTYMGWNGTHNSGGTLTGALDDVKLWNVVGTTADVEREVKVGDAGFDASTLAQSALNAITLPTSTSSNLTLPTEASNGSSINWSSQNADVISSTGIVSRPDQGKSDAMVALTATVSFGSKSVTRTFKVSVPALSDDNENSGYSENLLAESGMDSVEVADQYLQNASEKEIEYLLSFDTDRLLVEFRKNAGLDTKGLKNYGGWERGYDGTTNPNGETKPSRFTGHFVGHYISAISQAQRSTIATPAQKEQLATKLTAMVTGIREAQQAYAAKDSANAGFLPAFKVDALPAGKDGLLVPFYNLHKVEQGLIHAYEYASDQKTRDAALAAASDFGNFIVTWREAHPSVNMLSTEYGGMNDALYQLYQITGSATHLKAAHYFDEDSLFTTLAAGKDDLDGKHANTTIPKLTGAVQRYISLTENKEAYASLTDTEKSALTNTYLKAAENFWTMVKDNRSYVNGDNSQSEHFHVAGELWEDATQNGDGDGGYRNNSTSETCNAYNMLKLTRLLFQVTKDVKYSEYYEHTFINSIVASQNPETGMVTYFQPMKAGYPKVFGTEYGEFWCDQGTGVENFAKLNDSFYFTDSTDVYVNMFWSSTFNDKRHGLKITQTANVPKQDTVTFAVKALDGVTPSATNLKLRVPEWTTGATLSVNDQTQSTTAKDANGWLTVPITAGTRISYTLPAKLQVVTAPDNSNWTAFQYGPVVLAGALTDTDATSNYSYGGVLVRVGKYDATANAKASIIPSKGQSVADWLANIDDNVVRTDDPNDGKDLSFKFANVDGGASGVKLQPYYSLYKSTYALYFDMADVDSDAYQNMIISEKQTARDEARTSDSVTPDQGNNIETTANLQHSSDSTSAAYSGKTYRDAKAGGWFSYDLKVNAKAEHNYLNVQYNTADNGRKFDIYIDPTPLDTSGGDYGGKLSDHAVKLSSVALTNAAGTNAFYWEHYEIPPDVISQVAAGKMRIMFKSSGGLVGGVYGVQTLTQIVYSHDAKLASLSFDAGSLDKAFTPTRSVYTLTVPASTTSVNATIGVGDPGSYVKVNGIVIDDTKTRQIALDGDSTVVEIASYAQDQATVKYYAVTIVKQGTPIPSVSDPVVEYTFDSEDGAAANSSVVNTGTGGGTLNGTIKNSGASMVDDGQGGKALSLAGGASGSTSPYVEIPAGAFNASQSDMTMRVRVSWDGTRTCTWPVALGKDSKNYLAYIMNCGSNTRVEGSKNGVQTQLSGAVPTANTWVDVVAVLRNGVVSYYLDGVLVKQTSTTMKAADFIGTDLASGYLGKSFYNDPYFGGKIDDFRVWNRALTAAELFENDEPAPDPTVTAIIVKSAPTTVDYQIGDTFSPDGLVVEATLSDGSKRILQSSEYSLSQVDTSTVGTKTVTVTLNSDKKVITSFAIKVSEQKPDPVITAIEVTHAPLKTEYRVGDSILNAAGLEVTAKWSDGKTTVLDSEQYMLSGFNASTAGTKTVTVTLKDSDPVITATFDVQVSGIAVVVDTAGLESAVDDANGLVQLQYTTSSWKTLQSALAEANAVLADKSATQEQVDAATRALRTAIAGLQQAQTDSDDTKASTTSSDRKDRTSLDASKNLALSGAVIWSVVAVVVVLAAIGAGVMAVSIRHRKDPRQ